MIAAVAAAREGCKVSLYEKNEKLGKKLFITGKGRCNVTNACDMEELFGAVVTNRKFLFSSFYGFTNEDVMELFEEAGLPLKIERGNRVFPCSDHSSDVIAALERMMRQAGVKVYLRQEIKGLAVRSEEDTDTGAVRQVCGKYLKECGRLQNNTVVATIMSNMGLLKAMKREGIEVCVTTVGDKYVNEAMVANGYVLGGERSGHIIFSKHATTGDGILTALMLMEVILEKKQSLGTLCRGMQMNPQLLKNVKVEDKAAVTGNARVQVEKDRISTDLGEDGRILLRESGTEPVIRVMVEAQSDELCAKYVDEMVQVIHEEGLM